MNLKDKVHQLFEVTKLNEQFDYIAKNIQLSLKSDDHEVDQFVEAYFATTILPKIKDGMSEMFLTIFTEEDLDNLIEFWKSNVAQKYLKLLPTMSQEMENISEKIIAEYCSEYVISNEYEKWRAFKKPDNKMLN